MDLEKVKKVIQKMVDILQEDNITAQEWEKISNFIDREYDVKKKKSILPNRDKDTFQKLMKNFL